MADTRSMYFTSEPTDEFLEKLVNPDINLVMTSGIPEALSAIFLKTQITRYIKPLTEKSPPLMPGKIFLTDFNFLLLYYIRWFSFVLILNPTLYKE